MSLAELKNSTKLTDLTAPQIRELQQLLTAANYPLTIDGLLGPNTKTAFNSFKKDKKLALPDLIGPTTVKALLEVKPAQQNSIGKITAEGLKLIKEFEGFRTDAYLCSSNIPTVGYGATYYADGREVKMGDRITKAEAEFLLLTTLKNFEETVSKSVKVSLTSNQFSALVCFAFNVGVTAFKSSTLLKLINKGEFGLASNEFERWVKSSNGDVLVGLVRRRKAEKELFSRYV